MADKQPRVRTFIVGAGASRSANGRLADELLPPPSDPSDMPLPDEKPLGHVDDALNILARHAIPAGRMNFEEVLTEIDIRRLSKNVAEREAQELNLARRLLVAYALRVSSPAMVKDEGATRRFCQQLESGDVMVTFNYDILLEQALWQRGMWSLKNGYGFDAFALFPETQDVPRALQTEPEHGLVQVLKPHGSVSWRSRVLTWSPSRERDHVVSIAFDRGDLHGLEGDAMLYSHAPWGKEGGVVPEAFLMPSYVKSYATTVPFMRETWHLAYDRIRKSNEIWVVGYSIPEADTDAQLLLSAADPNLEPVFHIVDPCPGDVAKRLRQLVPRREKRLEKHSVRFEECDWPKLLC